MIDESKIPLKSIFKSSEVCEIVGVRLIFYGFGKQSLLKFLLLSLALVKSFFEKKTSC